MTVEVPELEAVEGIVPTSADLQLVESVQIHEGAVQPDGSMLLHLIRPCVGKGRGKHLYKAEMLEANASKFNGWKMYLNHLSEAARRALGGLPRDVRDVGGIVDESWWDGSVVAEGRFGQGAVIGRVKPVALIRDLAKLDPRLVECSINATATGVKPGKVGNEQVWVVEGISNTPPGSVDWVTEAGAGGQVASLMESVYAEDDPAGAFLDSLSYDELVAYMAGSRPDLAEAAARRRPTPPGGDDGEADPGFEALVKKFVGNGMPQAAAEKAARKAMDAKARESTDDEGDEVAELTPEQIREAFASDEGQSMIALAVREELRTLDLGTRVEALVESRLDEERDTARTEAEARLNRRAELTELREHAHSRIDGTKLTPLLKTSLRRRFDLIEGSPTPDLNVLADVDGDGSVTKSAREKLDEKLDACVKESFEILAEANPTRVRGQGPAELREGADKGGDDGEKDEPSLADKVGEVTAQLLTEAGIKDPAMALSITPESVMKRQGLPG